MKPSWERAAKIMKERYDPEMDGRILLGKVDCTQEVDLCRRHHIQGYPSIWIFRKGSDVIKEPSSLAARCHRLSLDTVARRQTLSFARHRRPSPRACGHRRPLLRACGHRRRMLSLAVSLWALLPNCCCIMYFL